MTFGRKANLLPWRVQHGTDQRNEVDGEVNVRRNVLASAGRKVADA